MDTNTKTAPNWKNNPEECRRLTMELIQGIEDYYMAEFKLSHQDYIRELLKDAPDLEPTVKMYS